MNCLFCKQEIADTAKYCRHCGQKQTMRCPQCGKEIEADAVFCTECGIHLPMLTFMVHDVLFNMIGCRVEGM